jgi:hypothetical protein
MSPAERDARETAEHLQRHSHEARAERVVNRLLAYVEGRKRTAHVLEVERIALAGLRCLKQPPGIVEEACWIWGCGVDEDLDLFKPQTQKVLKDVFGFV